MYCFKVFPFGLMTSAASCNRMMNLLLKDLEWLDSYVDDILVSSSDWESHLKVLETLFTVLRKANLSIHPSKCMFGFENLEFFGHVVGVDGLAPFEVSKVQNWLFQRPRKN